MPVAIWQNMARPKMLPIWYQKFKVLGRAASTTNSLAILKRCVLILMIMMFVFI